MLDTFPYMSCSRMMNMTFSPEYSPQTVLFILLTVAMKRTNSTSSRSRIFVHVSVIYGGSYELLETITPLLLLFTGDETLYTDQKPQISHTCRHC